MFNLYNIAVAFRAHWIKKKYQRSVLVHKENFRITQIHLAISFHFLLLTFKLVLFISPAVHSLDIA